MFPLSNDGISDYIRRTRSHRDGGPDLKGMAYRGFLLRIATVNYGPGSCEICYLGGIIYASKLHI